MPLYYPRVLSAFLAFNFYRLFLNRLAYLFLILITAAILIPLKSSAQVVFSTFEDARQVIGQVDFTATSSQVNDLTTVSATAIAVSNNGKLAVASQSPGRVLIWTSLPTSNGQPADVVIGKPNFTSTVYTSPTASNMRGCEGVAFSPDGSKVIVSDGENNRVLIWNSIPSTNGQPADLVIGQTDFTSNTAGTSANKLTYPAGVMVTRSGKLIINDAFNNRVLIYNSIPTTNNASADVVIGQTNINSNLSGNAATELNRPWNTVEAPDGKLLISDFANHRVLIYNSIPTTNGAAANAVIGQTGFNVAPTSGTSTTKLKNPLGLAISQAGKLAISDTGNNRVLLYNIVPTSNNGAADFVLGQANFTSGQDYSAAPNAKTTISPNGVQFDFNGRLYVAGKQGTGQVTGRVLVFGLPSGAEADLSISSQATMNLACQDITLQYQISIFNNGPTAILNAAALLIIPTELSLGSAPTPTLGTYSATNKTWTLPALKVGQSATITFTGTVSPSFSGQVIRQNAIITASSHTDNNLNNNGSGSELTVINNRPDAPIVNNVSVCTNNDTTLVASGSGIIRWFTIPSAGSPFFIGNTFNTPNLTATTTYYVESTSGTSCNTSIRVPVVVTVNQLITNNTITGDQVVCQFASPTNLSGSGPAGGNGIYFYQWQYSSDNSTWNNYGNSTNSINFNPGGIGGTTYFRRQVISGPCSSTFSNSVRITINPLPVVSFTGLPAKACNDTPLINLTGSPAGGTFTGPGISGNSFNAATAGTGVHTIRYSFTNSNGCTNTASASIIVGAYVSAGGIQNVCIDASTIQLTGFPAGGTWSGPGVSASGIFTPSNVGLSENTLTYSVTSTFGCFPTPQTVTSNKLIRVVPLPVISFGNIRRVCVDTADFYLKGHTPVNGNWSGTGIASDGSFSPRMAGVGNHTLTYRYQDGNGCASTGTTTVQVLPLPSVTLDPFTNKCSSNYIPFVLTGGAPAGGVYSGPGVNNNKFNPSLAGVGTHTITYTYKDANGCTGTAIRPIVVEVCYPVGIEEEKLNASLLIYPNPTDKDLNIQFDIPAPTSLLVKLVNVAGQQVLEQKYTRVAGNYNQKFDISKLAKGVYLLQLITDKAVINRRIVIQ